MRRWPAPRPVAVRRHRSRSIPVANSRASPLSRQHWRVAAERRHGRIARHLDADRQRAHDCHLVAVELRWLGATLTSGERRIKMTSASGRVVSKAGGTDEQQHFFMLSVISDKSLRFRLRTRVSGGEQDSSSSSPLVAHRKK